MTDASAMSESKNQFQLHPGRSLGWMNLGASIHGILSRLKAQPHLYPLIQLSYSPEEPISRPVHIDLPKNDIRLRFDGPDQRLRLIEIVGWSQSTFTYKNTEIVRRTSQPDKLNEPRTSPAGQTTLPGPSFRHIYNRLFGPAYAGEYLPPNAGSGTGTYVLSYPGLAIRFPLKHSAYSDRADFVSLLSTAASPATSIAVFSGSSWPEARDTLYTKQPPLPRSIALAGKNADAVPDEIETVVIHTGGRVELVRRSSTAFNIHLSETTPQDLVAELGPPDAIFRKPISRISIHAASQPSDHRRSDVSPKLHPSSVDTDRSSNTSLASGMDDDSETDSTQRKDDDANIVNSECFYNYFHHGFDILISHPATKSPRLPGTEDQDSPTIQRSTGASFENKLTATKIFLHGNIPGSYSFNRHRRSRWVIPLPTDFTPSAVPRPSEIVVAASPAHSRSKSSKPPTKNQSPTPDFPPFSPQESSPAQTSTPTPKGNTTSTTTTNSPNNPQYLTSEIRFAEISHALNALWSSPSSTSFAGQHHQQHKTNITNEQVNPYPCGYTSKGMVLNRGWTTDDLSSPESSVELLGGTMTMDDHGGVVSTSNLTSSSSQQQKRSTGTSAADGSHGMRRGGGGGGNTQLFGFPGLLFEVLDHGEISCVSIY